jgi:hypothetical protein
MMKPFEAFSRMVRRRASAICGAALDQWAAHNGLEAMERRAGQKAFALQDATALAELAARVGDNVFAGGSLPRGTQRLSRLLGWNQATTQAFATATTQSLALTLKAAAQAPSADALSLLASAAFSAADQHSSSWAAVEMTPVFARRWSALGGDKILDAGDPTGQWLRQHLPIFSSWLAPGASHRLEEPGAELAEALERFGENMTRAIIDQPECAKQARQCLEGAPLSFTIALGLAWRDIDSSSTWHGIDASAKKNLLDFFSWVQGAPARHEAAELEKALPSFHSTAPAASRVHRSL